MIFLCLYTSGLLTSSLFQVRCFSCVFGALCPFLVLVPLNPTNQMIFLQHYKLKVLKLHKTMSQQPYACHRGRQTLQTLLSGWTFERFFSNQLPSARYKLLHSCMTKLDYVLMVRDTTSESGKNEKYLKDHFCQFPMLSESRET